MNSSPPSNKVSVIIPARDSGTVLGECLAALKMSSFPIHEIIVVNDSSGDDTLLVAKQHAVKTIDLDRPAGANYCRNRGAAEASGDILLFLDSDVVVKVDTIQKMMSYFLDETVDAVVGLYSSHHRHQNLASQYKNLWIRFSYLKCGPRIDWIFGAVSAIRKSVVGKVRGFDRRLLMANGGEDLELGKRMTASAHNILLKPEIEVEHLKRHSLLSLLKNDFARSQGFVRLAGKLGELGDSLHKGFVNVYPAFVVSTLVSSLMLVSAALGFWFKPAWWLFVILAMTYIALNFSFLKYYARHRGLKSALAVVPLIISDHAVCCLGSAWGLISWLKNDAWAARTETAFTGISTGSEVE
jgi:glycosyltransferase involved in cell wall biosynthesis